MVPHPSNMLKGKAGFCRQDVPNCTIPQSQIIYYFQNVQNNIIFGLNSHWKIPTYYVSMSRGCLAFCILLALRIFNNCQRKDYEFSFSSEWIYKNCVPAAKYKIEALFWRMNFIFLVFTSNRTDNQTDWKEVKVLMTELRVYNTVRMLHRVFSQRHQREFHQYLLP